MKKGTSVLRNVWVKSRRTSLRMEPEIWSALEEIAHREGMGLNALIGAIDTRRGQSTLTGAARIYALEYFRGAARAIRGIEPSADPSRDASQKMIVTPEPFEE